jgi:hypothetical protein
MASAPAVAAAVVMAAEAKGMTAFHPSTARAIMARTVKGCEVREYVTEYGVGIGVVLPDYFITVEMLETGQSQSADMASAKNIAQQTIDALEKAGLLSQAAPDIEAGTAETEEKPDEYPATAEPLEEPVRIADTSNIMSVYNGPTVPTTFSVNSPHLVTEIHNYHWNDAQGATPGTISLQDQNGKMYGPWQAVGTPGQGGVPNANWHVYPNIVIPAGTSLWHSWHSFAGGDGLGLIPGGRAGLHPGMGYIYLCPGVFSYLRLCPERTDLFPGFWLEDSGGLWGYRGSMGTQTHLIYHQADVRGTSSFQYCHDYPLWSHSPDWLGSIGKIRWINSS